MAYLRLATAIDEDDMALRLLYTADELLELSGHVDLAQQRLNLAIARDLAPSVRDRLRAELAAAQAALAAAEVYDEAVVPPITQLRPGQLARLEDSCVSILRVGRTSIDVVRGYLGTVPAPHAAGIEVVPISVIGQVAIEVVIDGGGSAIDAGEKSRVVVPWHAGRIERVQLAADQVGDAVVDILRSAFGDAPGVGSSIAAATKPTLIAASTYDDAALVGWDTSIVQDDVLQFVVESASSVERLTVALTVRL